MTKSALEMLLLWGLALAGAMPVFSSVVVSRMYSHALEEVNSGPKINTGMYICTKDRSQHP